MADVATIDDVEFADLVGVEIVAVEGLESWNDAEVVALELSNGLSCAATFPRCTDDVESSMR